MLLSRPFGGLVRELYHADVEDGCFPAHIESNCDPKVAAWLERVLHLIPVNERPGGYNPLGTQRLQPEWIAKLGQTGRECFAAILRKGAQQFGAAMNECMRCWEAILPHTVECPAIDLDLKTILAWAQARYPGAMYSACGGGYLIVASKALLPGSLQIKEYQVWSVSPLLLRCASGDNLRKAR